MLDYIAYYVIKELNTDKQSELLQYIATNNIQYQTYFDELTSTTLYLFKDDSYISICDDSIDIIGSKHADISIRG